MEQLRFCDGIQSTGRLIQQEQRWIADKRPCNLKTLELSFAERMMQRADLVLISFRQPYDDLLQAGLLCCLINLIGCDGRIKQSNILADRAFKQKGLPIDKRSPSFLAIGEMSTSIRGIIDLYAITRHGLNNEEVNELPAQQAAGYLCYQNKLDRMGRRSANPASHHPHPYRSKLRGIEPISLLKRI